MPEASLVKSMRFFQNLARCRRDRQFPLFATGTAASLVGLLVACSLPPRANKQPAKLPQSALAPNVAPAQTNESQDAAQPEQRQKSPIAGDLGLQNSDHLTWPRYRDGASQPAQLLALSEPATAPTPNPKVNAVRSQYKTIDLNTLPSELRQPNPWPRVKSLLRDRYGRTTLAEGEEPTVISQPEYTREDYSFLIVVTVTNQGSADDSVGGFRYRFEFDSFDNDTMILVWAGSQQYCRRTQEWTDQLCP